MAAFITIYDLFDEIAEFRERVEKDLADFTKYTDEVWRTMALQPKMTERYIFDAIIRVKQRNVCGLVLRPPQTEWDGYVAPQRLAIIKAALKAMKADYNGSKKVKQAKQLRNTFFAAHDYALEAHEKEPTDVDVLSLLCSATGKLAEDSSMMEKVKFGFEFQTPRYLSFCSFRPETVSCNMVIIWSPPPCMEWLTVFAANIIRWKKTPRIFDYNGS
ncbi:unnamed protein product [Haemonchus placei]|uniref:Terpenoid synthase n=1 Tax=Haemonchus placei TaxID=6290 RepID=A0A0N4X7D8_HAEPC|nr:unnamed protein product [Haemonchus placei]